MKTEIAYYMKECSLGKILIAETYQGICSILFGEDELNMSDQLQFFFPNDIIIKKSGPSPDDIVNMIDKGVFTQNLQLDIRTGTDFQRLVWLNIMKIPRGKTITYKELAVKCGAPKAWRAVASACSHNIIAYMIPCHRVISSSGNKMNYRWGAERKKKLLDMEGANVL